MRHASKKPTRQCIYLYIHVCVYLLRTELMCAGHEVCAEQREADGVSALRGKLQTLLEHLLKRTAVEAATTKTQMK